MTVFKFKKKLGQHFISDNKILQQICSIRKITDQSVVEIGPGKGSLTKLILEKNPFELFVIEKDKTLEPYLQKIKNSFPQKVNMIFGDAVKIKIDKLSKKKILLIANLPYNIASTLIINWLEYINIFQSIIVMVQKEVAERLSASVSSKSYGRLSILVQLHAEVKRKFDVNPEKFFPQPKVVSTVIELVPKKKLDFNYEKLDELLKLSFLQRRKTIKNNLKKLNKSIEMKLIKSGINPILRPQDIKPDEYIRLSDVLTH
tara:strand:+ start:592 stop:1368 length:777 start_codon:yes stop_codon:yes gene_type:complete